MVQPQIRYFWGWINGECSSDSIRIIISDLQQQQCSHAGSSSSSNRLSQLEALWTVTSLSLTSNNIDCFVNQFSTFGVMSLGPIVTSTRCTKAHIIRFEECAHWRCFDNVHDARFQINQTCTRHKSHCSCFLIININLVQSLLVVTLFWLALEFTVWFQLMFFSHCIPERITNLVTALSNLDMDDLSHHIVY